MYCLLECELGQINLYLDFNFNSNTYFVEYNFEFNNKRYNKPMAFKRTSSLSSICDMILDNIIHIIEKDK